MTKKILFPAALLVFLIALAGCGTESQSVSLYENSGNWVYLETGRNRSRRCVFYLPHGIWRHR